MATNGRSAVLLATSVALALGALCLAWFWLSDDSPRSTAVAPQRAEGHGDAGAGGLRPAREADVGRTGAGGAEQAGELAEPAPEPGAAPDLAAEARAQLPGRVEALAARLMNQGASFDDVLALAEQSIAAAGAVEPRAEGGRLIYPLVADEAFGTLELVATAGGSGPFQAPFQLRARLAGTPGYAGAVPVSEGSELTVQFGLEDGALTHAAALVQASVPQGARAAEQYQGLGPVPTGAALAVTRDGANWTRLVTEAFEHEDGEWTTRSRNEPPQASAGSLDTPRARSLAEQIAVLQPR